MSKINSKVLVIGATGFIGRAVVELLVENYNKVFCFVRKTSKLNSLKNFYKSIVFFYGDILKKSTLIDPMKQCDVVINCSGLNSFWERNNKKYHLINVSARKNIAEAALETKVKKLVEVSTVMAYGFPKESPFNENSSPELHKSHYAKSKYLGDKLVWELYKTQNLPLVMVYLAAVLGKGDNKDVMKIGKFLQGKVPIMINSKNLFTYVYIKDAAKAILKATKLENNIGEKYLIGNQILTTKNYFQIISNLSGVPMPKKFIGKRFSLLLARIFTSWSKISKKEPLMPLDLIKTVFTDSLLFDTTKAIQILNLEYTPIEIAIREEIEYIKNKLERK